MYQAMNDAAGVVAFMLVADSLGEFEDLKLLSHEQVVDLVDRTQLTIEEHFHEEPDAEETMDACHRLLGVLMTEVRSRSRR